MSPEDQSHHRKADLILVLGAVLFLWGPGLATSPGNRAQAEVRPAAPRSEVIPPSPCQPDRLPKPKVGVLAYHDEILQVTVTGYSSSLEETDDTPALTATSAEARPGIIALSQDLLQEFTEGAPFRFHDWIEISGLGRFEVEDTMNPRWTRRADVWFPSREEALRWGHRVRRVHRVPDDLSLLIPMPDKYQVAATFGEARFH